VANAEVVHTFETFEYFSGVLLDVSHGQELLLPIEVLECVLEGLVTEFEHRILNDPLLLIERVEEVEELHHVSLATEHVEDFEFSRDDVPCFLGPLESDLALAILAVSFEYVAESSVSDYSQRSQVWLLVRWVLEVFQDRVICRITRHVGNSILLHELRGREIG
jgi:hypothetical protein